MAQELTSGCLNEMHTQVSGLKTSVCASSPRVLIVDDMPSVRTHLRQVIEKGGYNVIGEACDGDEAIKLAAELAPDIIAMDVTMKRISGIDATRAIHMAHPDIRIVMITGEARPSIVLKSIQAGAVNFIIKPFNETQILNVLNNTQRN